MAVIFKAVAAFCDLPPGWLWALLFVAAVGAFGWRGIVLDGVQSELATLQQSHAAALAEAQARAVIETNELRKVADDAQAQYLADMAAAKLAADRAATDLARLRTKSASADQLARASATALGDYAADAERSVDFCAGRLADIGATAGSASAAAYALHAGWPEYKAFQDRLTTFTNNLKGTK